MHRRDFGKVRVSALCARFLRQAGRWQLEAEPSTLTDDAYVRLQAAVADVPVRQAVDGQQATTRELAADSLLVLVQAAVEYRKMEPSGMVANCVTLAIEEAQAVYAAHLQATPAADERPLTAGGCATQVLGGLAVVLVVTAVFVLVSLIY